MAERGAAVLDVVVERPVDVGDPSPRASATSAEPWSWYWAPGGVGNGSASVEQVAAEQRRGAGDRVGDQQRRRGSCGCCAAPRPVGLGERPRRRGRRAAGRCRRAARRRVDAEQRRQLVRVPAVVLVGAERSARPPAGAIAQRPLEVAVEAEPLAASGRGRSAGRRRRSRSIAANRSGPEQSSLIRQTQSRSVCSRIDSIWRAEQLRRRARRSPCRSRATHSARRPQERREEPLRSARAAARPSCRRRARHGRRPRLRPSPGPGPERLPRTRSGSCGEADRRRSRCRSRPRASAGSTPDRGRSAASRTRSPRSARLDDDLEAGDPPALVEAGTEHEQGIGAAGGQRLRQPLLDAHVQI